MNPLNLMLWALAGCVSLVILGIGAALAVLLVESARDVARKKRTPELNAKPIRIEGREIARAVRESDRGTP